MLASFFPLQIEQRYLSSQCGRGSWVINDVITRYVHSAWDQRIRRWRYL